MAYAVNREDVAARLSPLGEGEVAGQGNRDAHIRPVQETVLLHKKELLVNGERERLDSKLSSLKIIS